MLLLIFLLVIIRVVDSFHKNLAVIDLVSHCATEQLADSRTISCAQLAIGGLEFEVVSGTYGLKSLIYCSTALIDLCGAKVVNYFGLSKSFMRKLKVYS